MNAKLSTKGFTIIEVVLVLAIAGLIFLMVFIALPALQSGQRDSARKNDVSIVSTAVTNYRSNNGGNTWPNAAQLQSYVQGLSDNSPVASITVTAGAATVTAADGVIAVRTGAICGSQGTTNPAQYSVTAGKVRNFAVITLLEGGSGTAYCLDNN